MTDTFIFNAREYRILEDPYINYPDGYALMEVTAVCKQDKPDENGYYPVYLLRWDIITPDADEDTPFEDMCDWDKVIGVVENGFKYNTETDRILY